MQQHALIFRADVEQRADFLRLAAFHVAQDDHGALAGRQTLDRCQDMIPQLPAADDALGIDVVP